MVHWRFTFLSFSCSASLSYWLHPLVPYGFRLTEVTLRCYQSRDKMSLADFPSHLLFRLGYMPMHKPVKARGCVYHDSLRPLKTLAWITWVVIGAGEMTDMWTKLECYLHAKMGECQWDVHNKMWHIRIPKTKIKNPLCRILKISACVKFQPWKLYSLTTCIHFVLHRNLVRSDPHPGD